MAEAEVIRVDGDQLKIFLERIERVAGEKDALAEDIKEIYAEAKEAGLNTKVMRRIIRERKGDREAIDGEKATYDAYMAALGDYADTPLGAHAVEKAAPKAAKAAAKPAAAPAAPTPLKPPAAAPANAAATGRLEKPDQDEMRDLKELGRRAGLAGKERDTNPCEAQSVDAQLWDTGWGLGHQEKVDQEALADGKNQRPPRAGRAPLFKAEESTAVN